MGAQPVIEATTFDGVHRILVVLRVHDLQAAGDTWIPGLTILEVHRFVARASVEPWEAVWSAANLKGHKALVSLAVKAKRFHLRVKRFHLENFKKVRLLALNACARCPREALNHGSAK